MNLALFVLQKMSISSVTFSSSQLPVLSRIVLSPFGTMQSIPSEKDFEKQSSLAVESYCTHFLSCSEVYQKSLTSNVNKETTEASNLLRRARDIRYIISPR